MLEENQEHIDVGKDGAQRRTDNGHAIFRARPLDDPYWNTPNGKTIVETVKIGHPVGWPGPTTPAAAEVVSSNVLTDMVTQVIVDKVTPEAAVDEANKRIKEIYDRLPVK